MKFLIKTKKKNFLNSPNFLEHLFIIYLVLRFVLLCFSFHCNVRNFFKECLFKEMTEHQDLSF